MRITIVVDSATPTEAFQLTHCFQKALRDEELPGQIGTLPTVVAVGSALTWSTPALWPAQAAKFLDIYMEEKR